jgi:hypothetical protein
MKNLASKAAPDGGALPRVIARWISTLQGELAGENLDPDSTAFRNRLNEKIFAELREMEFLVGGFDFARVLTAYYHAYTDGDDDKKSACLRWLRGEYATKTEARNEMGMQISCIIDDDNWYDFLKLWAALSRRMGYRGLVVFVDECVNLYKITHRVSRENNYEKILSMFNDTLQGRAPGLALILGGTPQFLEDPRRGLFSYEALRSRLCDSRFALDGFKNLIGPVIRLRRLSDDELFALIRRVTNLYAQNYRWTPRISEEEQIAFLRICLERAGANDMITPREMLRDYMTVLNILMQNENATFADIVGEIKLKTVVEEREEEELSRSGNAAQPPAHAAFDPNDIDF